MIPRGFQTDTLVMVLITAKVPDPDDLRKGKSFLDYSLKGRPSYSGRHCN